MNRTRPPTVEADRLVEIKKERSNQLTNKHKRKKEKHQIIYCKLNCMGTVRHLDSAATISFHHLIVKAHKKKHQDEEPSPRRKSSWRIPRDSIHMHIIIISPEEEQQQLSL